MLSLRQQLVQALNMEEIEMVELISYLINKINVLKIDEDVKAPMISKLNTLMFDTLRHGKIISQELLPMLENL